MMDTMNDLLICARKVYPDKNLFLGSDGDVWEHEPEVDHIPLHYNPLTNDAQAWELFKWLVDEHLGHDFVKRAQGGYWAFQGGKLIGISDTLNEAIVNACVEVMKDE